MPTWCDSLVLFIQRDAVSPFWPSESPNHFTEFRNKVRKIWKTISLTMKRSWDSAPVRRSGRTSVRCPDLPLSRADSSLGNRPANIEAWNNLNRGFKIQLRLLAPYLSSTRMLCTGMPVESRSSCWMGNCT